MIRIGPHDIGEFPLLLAPMEDVSDPPFRALCKREGADLMYTEFISVEGLIRDADKSVQKLDIYDEERPIGIQIFGAELDAMLEATDIVNATGPELLDINFGCPVKKVVCKMAGAGILQDIDRMVALTRAVVARSTIPVTVKTRLGWDESTIRIKEVAQRLQDVGIAALSIHGRTRKQMYKGEADWRLIGEIAQDPRIHIPIFGNGDVDGPERARDYRDRYGVQGIMIGRAAIGHPWVFREVKHFLATGEHLDPPTLLERVEAAREHLRRSVAWKGEKVGVVEMRRHWANYFRGLPGIKDYRSRLVTEEAPATLEAVLDEVLETYGEGVGV